MNDKQTAVEWLHNQLHLNISLYQDEWQIIEGLMEQAKAMEKEQIIDYHNFIIEKFVMLEYTFNTKPKIIIEQYYNETYESNT
jgi:hypothetical protein